MLAGAVGISGIGGIGGVGGIGLAAGLSGAAAVAAAIAYGAGSSATLGAINPAAYGLAPAGGVIGGPATPGGTTGLMPGMGAGPVNDKKTSRRKGNYQVARLNMPDDPVGPGLGASAGTAADLEPMPDLEDDNWW